MKPVLEVRNLHVWRGNKKVLTIPSLTVNEGETLAVIGPNGAGKSTLMLVISHLLQPTQGEIFFRGQLLSSKDGLKYRRRIALVLQDPLLLDASVFENVATGLRFRRISIKESTLQVGIWLKRLGIYHLRDRTAYKLSGGEAQRVSLARAFAVEPDILLLDEPFGALDAPTRAHLLDDFHTLITETKATAVFVTHDQNEALLMGDRVAVIINGQLRQIGLPEEVFNTPADADVAAFVGVETVIPGRVINQDDGCVIVEAGGLLLEAVGDIALDREVFFCLRPEDITLWIGDQLPASSARNRLSGQITSIKRQGVLERVEVRCCELDVQDGFSLVALVTHSSAVEMSLEIGQQVSLTFKASAVHLIGR